MIKPKTKGYFHNMRCAQSRVGGQATGFHMFIWQYIKLKNEILKIIEVKKQPKTNLFFFLGKDKAPNKVSEHSFNELFSSTV